jgi:hypothetical protein
MADTRSVSEAPRHAERRSGAERRSSLDRRQADVDCLAARILRAIDRDRRIGEERRRGLERRRFEKIIRGMRKLSAGGGGDVSRVPTE